MRRHQSGLEAGQHLLWRWTELSLREGRRNPKTPRLGSSGPELGGELRARLTSLFERPKNRRRFRLAFVVAVRKRRPLRSLRQQARRWRRLSAWVGADLVVEAIG